MKKITLLLSLLVCTCFSYAQTTHTVTNLNDSGADSFRQLATNAADGDTITFDVTGTIQITSQILINTDLTIIGPGYNELTIDANGNSRHIQAQDNKIWIEGLHFTNGGNINVGGIINAYPGNAATDSVFLVKCKFSNSTVTDAGAINVVNNRYLTIKDCWFDNCSAPNNLAGALIIYRGEISGTTFSNNTAAGQAGAIWVPYPYEVNIDNCTFYNNSTGFLGGAIYSSAEPLIITNSTFLNNYSTGGNYGNAITLDTDFGNPELEIGNTIIYNSINSADDIAEYGSGGSVVFNSYGYNIFENNSITNFLTAGTDQIGNAPTLGNFGFHGGPTPTIPYLANSIGINQGNPALAAPDQRKFLRNGNADVGAYEFQGINPACTSLVVTNNIPADVCLNNGSMNLASFGSPAGGTFSGAGVSNNHFNPVVAGVGNHDITYIYTNSAGCTDTATASIEVLSIPSASLAITNATCSGGDGAVDATISGGTLPYDIYWSNGSTTEDVDELSAGIYYINVTDDNGCQTTKMANVSSDAFTINSTITDVSCHGGSDGNIDITINGTTGPYTVEWLNNGSNAEDATNIVAGTWEVYVEDANGCAVSQVFEVGEPDDITWTASTIEATCGSSDGSAQCLVMGGTAPYNFQWFDASGSPVGTNADNLTGITAGEYSVLITDDHGCSKIWNAVVTEVGGPVVNIDTVINAQCTNNGAIDISIASTNGIQSINWNNGATAEDLSGLAPGYYAVEVVDNSGCTGMAGTHVTNSAPEPVEICIVGVDTSTITNKVVWEKPVTTSISHYNIYRETSTAGQYQFVDSVLYANESFFVDTVAYPHIKSWRYKITAVNNCGVESDKSPAHKTIHLVKNLALGGGINLAWDHYEGFSYPTYFVYRHTDVNGWEQIDQIASTASTTLNDAPPSTNQLDYFVSVEPPNVCESTKATSHNASRSNRSSGIAGPNGGGNGDDLNVEEIEVADLKLFPNPTTGLVNIQWEKLNSQALYDVYDGAGKLIRSWSSNKMFETINLERLERGIYIISITNNDVKQQYRVVKQ